MQTLAGGPRTATTLLSVPLSGTLDPDARLLLLPHTPPCGCWNPTGLCLDQGCVTVWGFGGSGIASSPEPRGPSGGRSRGRTRGSGDVTGINALESTTRESSSAAGLAAGGGEGRTGGSGGITVLETPGDEGESGELAGSHGKSGEGETRALLVWRRLDKVEASGRRAFDEGSVFIRHAGEKALLSPCRPYYPYVMVCPSCDPSLLSPSDAMLGCTQSSRFVECRHFI